VCAGEAGGFTGKGAGSMRSLEEFLRTKFFCVKLLDESLAEMTR
jgi:hypothetical protein